MEEKKYILAVPNFSEGRRQEVIDSIAATIENREDVKLIRVDPEYEFNRTVLTIIGKPEPLKKALLDMAAKSYELIDMSEQEGGHPRIGSQDTIPLFPFRNITLDEVRDLADEIGKELYEEHGVPIFFSGENARTEDKASISFIRKGQYEGLKDLLKETKDDPERSKEYSLRKPDLSKDGLLSDKLGATIVSAAMEGLTAYNIFLNTEDLSIAKKISNALRAPSGGFSTIRSVGIKFPERDGVVVSMNLFDCSKTPIYRAFEFVKQEAEKYGVAITGSELVGPVKLDYLLNNLLHYLRLEEYDMEQILEYHLMDI